MSKRNAACFVVAFAAMFGAAACGGEGQQQAQQQDRVDQLAEQVEEQEEVAEIEELQADVAEMQVLLGFELEEEPKHEQTQPERTQ